MAKHIFAGPVVDPILSLTVEPKIAEDAIPSAITQKYFLLQIVPLVILADQRLAEERDGPAGGRQEPGAGEGAVADAWKVVGVGLRHDEWRFDFLSGLEASANFCGNGDEFASTLTSIVIRSGNCI